MAINFPGPYDIRIVYLPTIATVQTISHISKLNVALEGTPAQGLTFAEYDFEDINGATTIDLATLVEDYLAVYNALLRTDTDIVSVELWKYPTAQSSDSTFWSSYTPTANVGTAAGASISAGQEIFSFRSQEGGNMKVEVIEGVNASGPPVAYAGLSAAQAALVDFILDGDESTYSAPFLARDTSYPFNFTFDFPGINEKLWKFRNGR